MSRPAPERRYPRTARLNELVRQVLADEIERVDDARVGFVTITGVDVTGDLRQATIYYSALGSDEAREETAEALRSLTVHLKTVLARQVRMKYTPSLIFREDPALTAGERIEQIIRALHEDGDDAS